MTQTSPSLDLDAQLCFPLYAATRAVTRRYSDLLGEVGLTYPQYLTLLALFGADGPMSVGELGARLRLDSGTLTPLLKRMEAAGLVTRRRDQADERRVVVALTAAGAALEDRLAGVPGELFAGLDLSVTEARQLGGLLSKVLTSLDPRPVEVETHPRNLSPLSRVDDVVGEGSPTASGGADKWEWDEQRTRGPRRQAGRHP